MVSRVITAKQEAGIRFEPSLEPSVILFPAKEGEIRFLLEIEKGTHFQGICYHPVEAYPVPRYINQLEGLPICYLMITKDHFGYTFYFCLSRGEFRVSMEAGTADAIQIRGFVPEKSQEWIGFLCVRGKNLTETVQKGVEAAIELTGGVGKMSKEKPPLPKWLYRLGWESRLAFGKDPTHQGVLHAISDLKKQGSLPGYVLIDEGWQHLAYTKEGGLQLSGFDADPQRFPRGLKGFVSELHGLGVPHVGVWHGLRGYRNGLHPNLSRCYGLEQEALGKNLGRAFEFFHDYYRYLGEQGIDFVKVGDQDQSLEDSANLHSAIQAAASIQFNGAELNADCLRNENLFTWTTSRIARTAEDIDLLNPVGVNRSIRNNLVNAFWLQYLMQPDFDVWLTNIPQSETLAIFHALSGSIHMIGDGPGDHQSRWIWKVMFPNGELNRADRCLTLCEESLFVDPLEDKHIYKAHTIKGKSGIVGAFNLASGQRMVNGMVSPSEVPELHSELYAAFSDHRGFLGTISHTDSVPVSLKPQQSEVISFTPIQQGVAVIGCHHYFLPSGPIIEVDIEEENVHIISRVSAPLFLYCEHQILEVRRNGATIPFEYDHERKTLSIDSRSSIQDQHTVYQVTFE